MQMFFYLILGHFICDYPLQTDFVAQRKCRRNSLPVVPWYYVMSGHCATHAAAVAIVTGNAWLALSEFVAHYAIDVAKCEGWTGIHLDQYLHVGCKAAWMLILMEWMT